MLQMGKSEMAVPRMVDLRFQLDDAQLRLAQSITRLLANERRHLGGLTARLDAINVSDSKYEIRDGTGVGVGAPQFGARRGLFAGLSKAL